MTAQVVYGYALHDPAVEVGPSPYSVPDMLERLKAQLNSFSHAPWTLQRLCEIVLEPRKQYTKLPKVRLVPPGSLLVQASRCSIASVDTSCCWRKLLWHFGSYGEWAARKLHAMLPALR